MKEEEVKVPIVEEETKERPNPLGMIIKEIDPE